VWPSWQRGFDYYPESDLIWLDADTKIRQLSNGQKSLDDFAKLFFGINNGSYVTVTYTLEDLVKALNTVQPYDWVGFFHTRVYEVAPEVPEEGIKQGGYRLVYNDSEPDYAKHSDPSRPTSFGTSLGFTVAGQGGPNGGPAGAINDVVWDGPAFKAGITPDMQIQAVNEQAFNVANLRQAMVAAEKTDAPMKLLLKRDDQFLTVTLDYHGGLRYPHLERVESAPNLLDRVLAPSD
jgi:predicted metalloprotease with PDZ domain